MTAASDVRDWLQTPAGRVYSVANSGDGPAFDKLSREDAELARAVGSLNMDRMSRGLTPLSADAARIAVAPQRATVMEGTAPEMVQALSRDPGWRWSWSPEAGPQQSPGVVWSGTVG